MNFPNLNSLMKISLGLIFFTILSTVFVYAETISDNSSVNIMNNAYSQDSISYLSNSLFSVTSGSSVTIVNNDTVSHKFVSGTANSELDKNKNYDTYLSSPINSTNRKMFTSKKINFRFHLPNYFYLRFSGRKYKSVSGCKVIPSISSRTAKV